MKWIFKKITQMQIHSNNQGFHLKKWQVDMKDEIGGSWIDFFSTVT